MASIFSGAFSTNDEISTSRIACRARDWLWMAAHCRSVWRAGNFSEGELQHVVHGLVRVDVYVAAFSLDGLMEHNTELDTTVCYTDTHGYTEVVMATAALLGYELAPRIKDQTLYKMDRQQHYANLDPILSGTIKPHVIRNAWDATVRVIASMEERIVSPLMVLQRRTRGSV